MSKLNPQKASAYVGPGVLRKGGKITPVPNGPLVKKKGVFKGSTLRSGGKIKKAVNGTTTTQTTDPPMTRRDILVANIKEQARLRQNLADFKAKVGSTPLTPQLRKEKDSLSGLLTNFSTNQRVQATGLTPAQLAANDAQAQKEAARKPDVVDQSCEKRGLPTSGGGCSGSARKNAKRLKDERNRKNGGIMKKAQQGYTSTTKVNTSNGPRYYQGKSQDMATAMKIASFKSRNTPADSIPKAKVPKDKLKAGGMIKRADGSYSKRGLWDNIRANKGSGKKPTKQMLQQEKKIKAKSKK